MKQYSYQAMDGAGKPLQGLLDAGSENEARRLLRSKGYYVTAMEELRTRFAFGIGQVALDDIILFSHQFASMLKAGIPVLRGLGIMENQVSNRKFQQVLAALKKDVGDGLAFSEALRRQPKVFPLLYIDMVQAGETGGQLAEVLLRVTAYYENQQQYTQRLRNALTYPAIVLMVAIGVIVLLMSGVIPVFQNVYGQLKIPLPLPTILLIRSSGLFIAHWPAVLLAAALAGGGFAFARAWSPGRRFLDRCQLAVPVWGDVQRHLIIANFTRALATLTGGGIPLPAAVTLAEKVANNLVLRDAVAELRRRLDSGKGMFEQVPSGGIFPPALAQLLAIGEETGRLGEMLDLTAATCERLADRAIRKMVTVLEPGLTLLLGGLVFFIALAIYLPMFDLILAVGK